MFERWRTPIAALGALALAAPVYAQAPEIDFGDNASTWAHDGECDDPRFTGRGMTDNPPREDDRGHDAADCRAAYEAGRLSLREPETAPPQIDLAAPATDSDGDAAAPTTVPIPADLDFGDDTSLWANDGECDDPRFAGEGVSDRPQRDNIRRDAADCRAALEAGRAVFAGEIPPLWSGAHDGVEFGDNAGGFPGDGECDDPRFAGAGVALNANRLNARHDAHDCREAYDAGEAEFVGEIAPGFEGVHDEIDFGDNSGGFPFDDECDDPRFSGENVAEGAIRDNVRKDADDCRRAYDQGLADYDGELPPLFEGVYDGVDFGDNSAPYVDDDECDDPRFSGEGVAPGAERPNVRRDAHDCHDAYLAGTAIYDGELPPLFAGLYEGVDFGNNEGSYVEDGECDDRRFRGHGMARPPWAAESEYRDAADCQALFAKGFIRYVVEDGLFEGRLEQIDFGDNSGAYVNDGECDDSRFEGPGTGITDGANDLKDAFDCKMNLEEGSILLK
jgi:hypothetical protein